MSLDSKWIKWNLIKREANPLEGFKVLFMIELIRTFGLRNPDFKVYSIYSLYSTVHICPKISRNIHKSRKIASKGFHHLAASEPCRGSHLAPGEFPEKSSTFCASRAVAIPPNIGSKRKPMMNPINPHFSPIFPMKMAIIHRDIYGYIYIFIYNLRIFMDIPWIFRGDVPFRDKGPHTRVSRAVASPTTVVLPQVVI